MAMATEAWRLLPVSTTLSVLVRHLRDFLDIFCVEKRKVTGAIAEAFELASRLKNQDALADTGPSTELESIKNALTTAQTEGENFWALLDALQQKHYKL